MTQGYDRYNDDVYFGQMQDAWAEISLDEREELAAKLWLE